ncbi:MAG: SprT-like family protein [Planctomycetota bacterium]
MSATLLDYIEKTQLTAAEITERTRRIYELVLRGSRHLEGGNFNTIHLDDLRLMFLLYDEMFFAGLVAKTTGENGLALRISSRMTSSGGKTTRLVRRRDGIASTRYEITVSSHLLFQTFRDVERPVTVSGILCRDRLEALQRIFEHELLHLVELLLWKVTSCSAPRFQRLAQRLFGHTKSSHDLVTTGERALAKFRVRVGDHVSFQTNGVRYAGIVSRITKRATVLVENEAGVPYSDGKRYLKAYVPLMLLEAPDA